LSIFGHQLRFNLAAGFPMLTTKKLRSIDRVRAAVVLRRYQTSDISGQTRFDRGRMGRRHGDLGPVYGSQWRSGRRRTGRKLDQIANVSI